MKQKLIFKKGQKFGLLKIIKSGGTKNGHRCWFASCICGRIREIEGFRFKHNLIKSCGYCKIFKLSNHHSWKGYQEISGFTWNSKIIRGAKNRRKPFKISIKFAWDLFIKQKRKCALTGIDICFSKSWREDKEMTASLDRINSSKGYLKNNVRWVHKRINIMRNNMSDEEFINWCYLVSNYAEKN
jgi:hypothetical protein